MPPLAACTFPNGLLGKDSFLDQPLVPLPRVREAIVFAFEVFIQTIHTGTADEAIVRMIASRRVLLRVSHSAQKPLKAPQNQNKKKRDFYFPYHRQSIIPHSTYCCFRYYREHERHDQNGTP
jgi:hypothetical protein